MEGGVKGGGQGEKIKEMLSRAPVPERDTGKRTSASWEGLVYYVSHQTRESQAKKQDKDTLTELSFSEWELGVFLRIRIWDHGKSPWGEIKIWVQTPAISQGNIYTQRHGSKQLKLCKKKGKRLRTRKPRRQWERHSTSGRGGVSSFLKSCPGRAWEGRVM